MALANIVGDLRTAYKQIEAGTMLHSNELQVARLIDPSLQALVFYTADGMIYYMEGDVPHLAVTREGYNPVLLHIDDACTQLIETGNYRPSAEDVRSALTSKSTVHIDLTQLRLEGNDERRYLTVPTWKYDSLNPEERKLAECVHGSGLAFKRAMNMLGDTGTRRTSIYVLSLDYVREHAKEGAIGRTSWLYNIINSSDFNANDRRVNLNGRLRGIPRSTV